MFGTPPKYDRNKIKQVENPDVEIRVDGKPISLHAWRAQKRMEYLVDLNDYVTSAEIIELLRVDHATLKRWRRKGKIHHKKVGDRWYYAAADLPALANEP